jgi:hypothetical protein
VQQKGKLFKTQPNTGSKDYFTPDTTENTTATT